MSDKSENTYFIAPILLLFCLDWQFTKSAVTQHIKTNEIKNN